MPFLVPQGKLMGIQVSFLPLRQRLRTLLLSPKGVCKSSHHKAISIGMSALESRLTNKMDEKGQGQGQALSGRRRKMYLYILTCMLHKIESNRSMYRKIR